MEQLLASERPVFVDFTAAWCVTCQYNKKTVLQDPEVLADLAAGDIALLRADWTLRDPAITAALAALGRNGVPLYVLYSSNVAPRILSEILRPGSNVPDLVLGLIVAGIAAYGGREILREASETAQREAST